jgi:hypothetical protein
VLDKRRYQRALRKEGTRLSREIPRTAPQTGHDARLMNAAVIAGLWLHAWLIDTLIDDWSYSRTPSSAAASAVDAIAWWLIYRTRADSMAARWVTGVASRPQPRLCRERREGCSCLPMAPWWMTSRSSGRSPSSWPARKPEAWAPSLVSAHYIVVSALAQAVEERQATI